MVTLKKKEAKLDRLYCLRGRALPVKTRFKEKATKGNYLSGLRLDFYCTLAHKCDSDMILLLRWVHMHSSTHVRYILDGTCTLCEDLSLRFSSTLTL